MEDTENHFQRIAQLVQEFLGKLACEAGTAELRDALNLTLLYMQKYYKTLRSRSQSSNNLSPHSPRCIGGSLIFTSSCGAISPVSPACGMPDIFAWKWYNVESPKLSASLGTNEFSLLTPFLLAVKAGDLEMMKDLIEKDFDCIENLDGLGRNAVMYAVHGHTDNHIQCLELLLDRKCDVNQQANDKSTALHVAAHENNAPSLSLLLKHKASCTIEDHEGRTPLHWAAGNSSLDNLKLLLQHGANVDALDCEGLTPAMWACHFEQQQNLRTLRAALERFDPRDEALFEQKDLKGKTVVHWAVNKDGSLDCLKELLTNETAMLCDSENKNVLHTAAEQGCLAACELVLDVCGSECLTSMDSQGRTPLHLAAMCGQAQIVNFLLDVGAALKSVDSSGATPVDYIKSKQLYYCMMVLCLHPQYQELLKTERSIPHKEIMEARPPCMKSPRIEAFVNRPSQERTAPSAPPADEVLRGDNTPDHPPQGSHEDIVELDLDGEDCLDAPVFGEHHDNEHRNRSQSVPHEEHRPPKPLPRKQRNQSAPPDPGDVSVGNHSDNNYSDSRELQQRNSSPGEDDQLEHDIEVTNEVKRAPGVSRRHSLLTRQDGIQEDATHKEFDSPTFDMRTNDGDVVVLMGDIDSLQAAPPPPGEDDIDHDNAAVDDPEENFGYSSARLHQGRGSASSEHSEPDHADNGSVSVGLSVSSLGSDNEELLHVDEPNNNNKNNGSAKPEKLRIPAPSMTQGWSQPVQPAPPHPPSPTTPKSPYPPSQSPRQMMPSYEEASPPNRGPMVPEPLGATEPKPKKKKDKKKKKQKSPPIADIPPPRGFIAPLEPPSFRHGPGPKLGGLDPIIPKSGPWEHSSLGVLRRGSPEPHPPGGRTGKVESPRYVPPGYGPSDELEIVISDEEGFEDDEIDYGRPRTPEPSRSPRDMMGKPGYHPAPPGMGAGRDLPYRGPMDDREAVYGPAGPLHGPLAHKNGQALLRNTDMAMRVSPPNKMADPRGMTSLPRGPKGHGNQSGFGLQSPLPHPPQR